MYNLKHPSGIRGLLIIDMQLSDSRIQTAVGIVEYGEIICTAEPCSVVCDRLMQAMLDRLIPLLLNHLFLDYKKWVDEEALDLQLNTIPLSEALLSSKVTLPELVEASS